MMFTLKNSVQAELKILRSRFIASLYSAPNPETARQYLNEHNQRFADATHNCYAYVCGLKQEITYYSDAGEPGGTAGKPILNALLRHDLTNVLAVVTRYYGGVKLGVKGLIEAYGEAVESAVMQAELVEAKELVNITINCDYPILEIIKHRLTELKGECGEAIYTERVSLKAAIPREAKADFLEFLYGYQTQSRLDYLVEEKRNET